MLQLTAARDGFGQLAWTESQRAHITLVFLGSVSDEVVDRLADQLHAVCSATDPFRIWLAGAGHFGRATLWAGVDGDTQALAELHHAMVTEMGDWAASRRDWSAHLTLARGRRHGDVRPAARALDQLETDSWQVDAAYLMQSDTQSRGAIYRQLRTLPLRGGPASAP